MRRSAPTPPELYFVGSAIFHYLGPAFAVLLFARVEPLGVAWLRIASAGADLRALAATVARAPRPASRASASWSRSGVVFAVMNACFYLAIDRLPLGTVAAIEFLPGDRARRARRADGAERRRARASPVVGVYALVDVRLEGEPVGVAFAFANAVLFALYIVLAHRVARSPR